MNKPESHMMNIFRTFVAALFLLSFPLFAIASQLEQNQRQLPQNFNRLSGPQSVTAMSTELLDASIESPRLRFSNAPLDLQTIELGGTTFESIRMDGEGATIDPGYPDLPRVTRMVMIGNHGNVMATVTNQSYSVTLLDHLPAPVQILAGDDNAPADGFTPPDPSIYGQDVWYPSQIAEISDPATLRDVRFVILTTYPVQVNMLTGEMRSYNSIEVEIDNIGGNGINEISIVPTSLTPGFKKLYSAFENFEGSALDALPVVPGKQLIICDSAATVRNEVQKLVDWRRKKGIDASYVSLYSIPGGTGATAIRDYISSQYNSSNGQLEFVTVVGDPNASTPFLFPSDGTQLDNFYGALNPSGGPNPDPVPDIAVGRLPVSSAPQIIAMVAKTIQYESDPFVSDTTWFTRGWCAAHTNFIASNPSTKQYTRQIMLQHGFNEVNFDVFGGGMVETTLNTRINQGVSIFNDRMSWVNEFVSSQLGGLSNGRRLPFVMVVTCGTGTFSGGAALTEDWVRNGTAANPVGAIGCVGMSGLGTHVPYNNIVDAGVMYGFFVQDIEEQGIALIAGKLQLYKNYAAYGGISHVQDFSYWANLMGDPGVPVWRKVPRAVSVTKPATVNRLTNNIGINVARAGNPLQGALVGLLKGSETFARGYTDAAGNINLSTNLPTNGYIYLTVSKSDVDTYLDSIQVVDAVASLSYNSLAVDDDNVSGTVGDGNTILNPGETVDLNIGLVNSGTSNTVTGITASLTTSMAGIQIINGSRSYADLAPSATGLPNLPFRIQVNAVFNNEPIAFFLNTSSSAGTQTVRVDLTPVAADVSYTSSAFSDGNNRLDPGDTGNLTVTFNNSGNRSLSNANAILRSMDSHVVVSDSIGSYGNVAIGANSTNGGNPFNVSTTAQTVNGYSTAMQLVITDANGFRDSVNFNQTVGVASTASPTGPDAYGYYAYDNTETQPGGTASNYQWTEIIPALGGLGTSLGFTDGAEDGDQSAVRTLPFSFNFYGQTFTEVTICTNGWLAFGNQSNIDFRNYHIGSAIGPINQVCAYWDDLKVTGISNGGVYYYSDAYNHRYIVEWRTQTLWSNVDEVFQIVLYDPAFFTSPTGDGKIQVQYQSISTSDNQGSNDNDWATVGIQNRDHSVGLEYSYWNVYSPNSAPLAAGRSIMYTTAVRGNLIDSITVAYPNGGEVFYADSSYTISWFTGLTNGNVSLEISRNGVTGPWQLITASTPNDGAYDYVFPAPTSIHCLVRITSLTNPAESDISNAEFTIGQIQNILVENFDTGAPGWTHGSAGGQWIDQWNLSTERAFSGTTSYKCGDTLTGDYSPLNDARLASPVINNLPASTTLSFVLQIESETSAARPDSCYDGGIVEISANGGAFVEIFPNGGYPKTFRYTTNGTNPVSGPMPGLPCYAGTITTWTNAIFDLAAYSGQNIQLRWRFGSDAGGNREGWYVDNVRVFAPQIPSAVPPTPAGLTIYSNSSQLTLRWNADTNTNYKIFSSTTSDGPFTTLEGTSTTNFFDVPGGPSDVKKFYVVVGWDGN